MKQLTEKRLREIIKEEMNAMRTRAIKEDVDHEGVRTVVNAASKLLKAVAAFEEDANGAMTNAVTPHLSTIKSTLEAMVSTPASYVDTHPKEPKIVKLRKVKDDS